MVLNEFVCGSNGTSHSALFNVTRGTFAFIAGQVTKTGCLRIDTPVGSIRSRARSGGIGMLSLTALFFSLMKEVQAASSDVTFLDDGRITYKDLEHGVFELVTKDGRHIIVDDPGETIVLSESGSTSVVTNTPDRMEQLQLAQQETLATYALGQQQQGIPGSSTPDFSNPLAEPINFIPTNDSLVPQIAPQPTVQSVVGSSIIEAIFIPSPQPATVSWAATPPGTGGTAIPLGTLSATVNSLTGGTLQSLVVRGIPVGDTLSD